MDRESSTARRAVGTGPTTATVRLDEPVGDDAADRLDREVRSLITGGAPAPIVCDVAALDRDPRESVRTIELLLRLQLEARRRGSAIRLSRVGAELQALLALLGLTETLPEHTAAARSADDRQ